ncbi:MULTISPECIES: AraC family transcriptional regulator [unclassified Paenibacillus]|uniref:helix-turn-helix domain-containing protein n=1 Tax=unclassified Paenibacillus TaxID=185978 RepID=UPI000953DAA4|nr:MULTISPECIES: AraC family transcriptional regulator [unclassified Paenibacillus]ASS68360.1 helix-turn-helix transcriptional regulator [Paenibacillus sp. RUD330]SIR30360.1 Helix-turn-helix domain-containing protein [Paenibacillus sp. RU4X]SIR42175.1 Helix-turn-helix domain-containing protein [Paenibacillus sp. RU4T]
MASSPGKHSFRISLFRRYFASYFALILVPAIAACALAQVLAVRLIENDARKLSDVMVSRVSDQTDASFQSLRANMLGMLSGSGLSGLLRTAGGSLEDRERSEMIHSLRQQLGKVEADPLASRVYLYMAKEDMVIDPDAYTGKSYYFTMRYPLGDGMRHELAAGLKGRKMLDFVLTGTEQQSAVISYPFNTDSPEAYLVVQLNQRAFGELLRIPEPWAAGTMLLNREGEVIGQSGLDRGEALRLSSLVYPGSSFRMAEDKGISLVPSKLDNGFAYLSVVDMPALMKPVTAIRIVSWMFLLFFLVVGGLASYHLSRRSYRPIREIRESFGMQRALEPASGWRLARGSELDAIRDYSRLIVSENRQLSKRMDGLLPMLREHLLARLLLGEGRAPEDEAEELGLLPDRDSGTAMTVFCIEIHYGAYPEMPLSGQSRRILMTELKERILELLPPPIRLAELPSGLLACVAESAPGGISPAECAGRIRAALLHHAAYYTATIGVGCDAATVEELPASCRQAIDSLQQRSLGTDVEICAVPESGAESAWAARAFLPVKELNRVTNLCGSKDYDGLLEAAYSLIGEGAVGGMTAVRMKSLCADLLNAWIRASTSERDVAGHVHAGLYEQLGRCMTGDELRKCFTLIHGVLFPKPCEDRKAKKFAAVLDYIHEHYDEELSLDYFACQLGMSAGHFSRLFKEEVGEKYVEYLAMYRLKKAKELLLSTDLRIDDIAGKVGYWGRHSFIRVFRKYEGVTPAQYRSSRPGARTGA